VLKQLVSIWVAVAVFVCLMAAMPVAHAAPAVKSATSIPKLSPVHKNILATCREQIRSGEHREAFKALTHLRSRIGRKQRHPQVESLLAESYLKEGRPKSALAYVKPYTDDRSTYDRGLIDPYIQSGNAHLALKMLDEALVIFDWIAAEENGKYLPAQVRAVDGVGRVYMAQKKDAEALHAFNFAIQNIRAYEAMIQKETEGAQLDADLKALLKSLQRRASALARKLRDEAFRTAVGEAFILYRDAERLRGSGRSDQARAKFQELIKKHPKTTYAEAARLYSPMCLVETADPKKVAAGERELAAFVAREPVHGLYKGQGLLELGRVAIEYRVNDALADKRFARLDEWITAVRKQKEAPKVLGIYPGAQKLITPPASEWAKKDFWGHTPRNRRAPGQLVNRATSSWYLDDVEEQCATFRGFLLFAKGKNEKALGQYKRALALDATLIDGDLATTKNNFTRLKWGAEHGYLFAYPEELKLYNGRQRLAVLLGDFYYITQQFGKSRKLFGRLVKGDFGKLSEIQKDYPLYAIAFCKYRGGFDEPVSPEKVARRSMDEFAKALETRSGSLAEYRAAYMIAMIAEDFTHEPELKAKRRSLLKWIGYQKPYNRITYKGRLVYAIDLIRIGDKQEIAQGFKILDTQFPKSSGKFVEVAEYFKNYYRKQLADGGRKNGEK
jgi:TolA-binding protein